MAAHVASDSSESETAAPKIRSWWEKSRKTRGERKMMDNYGKQEKKKKRRRNEDKKKKQRRVRAEEKKNRRRTERED